MTDKRKQLIGKLSDYRCPECGASLYVNAVGSAWCSNCEWDDVFNCEKLVRLPPADEIRQRDAELRALLGEDDG